MSVERVAKRLCQFDHGDDWERIWKSYDSIRASYCGKAIELLSLVHPEEQARAAAVWLCPLMYEAAEVNSKYYLDLPPGEKEVVDRAVAELLALLPAREVVAWEHTYQCGHSEIEQGKDPAPWDYCPWECGAPSAISRRRNCEDNHAGQATYLCHLF